MAVADRRVHRHRQIDQEALEVFAQQVLINGHRERLRHVVDGEIQRAARRQVVSGSARRRGVIGGRVVDRGGERRAARAQDGQRHGAGGFAEDVVGDAEGRRHLVVDDGELRGGERNQRVPWVRQGDEEGLVALEVGVVDHGHRDGACGLAGRERQRASQERVVGGAGGAVGRAVVYRHGLAAGGRQRDRNSGRAGGLCTGYIEGT